MTKLIITRGLPASGKSTKADEWVSQDPTRRAQVNRDGLRKMMHGSVYIKPNGHHQGTERQVQAARDAAISALLGRGIDVVCSDTNLPTRVARDLRRLAVLADADFEVWDMTDVPYETCVSRNDDRKGDWPPTNVPDEVIYDMYMKFVRGKGYPLPLPEEAADEAGDSGPYERQLGLPRAVLVDVDGTLAKMGTRSPFDETRVHEDQPNHPVVATVEALDAAGYTIIICSGRSEDCRQATEVWLDRVLNLRRPYEALFMRPSKDFRKDAVVKREIFDREIRHQYDVQFVIDDRDQVVQMWRSMGLTAFQVADGNF